MRIPLLIITGPTGVGKTEESINIAKKYNGEIVISDSVQIYKYLDIGSGKPTQEEMKNIPHYLIDILEPDEEYDTARFSLEARKYIKEIWKRGNLPIIVGGCGFYIKTLLEGIFKGPKRDEELRDKIKKEGEEKGWNYVYEKLEKIDPVSSSHIHPHDKVRIIRALEVFYLTGKPISWYIEREKKKKFFDYLMISIIREREELYHRINDRVEKMWNKGWVKEVENILKMGYSPDSPGLRSIGYKEIVEFLKGEKDEENAKKEIKKKTRNYAKRQIIWLRKENPLWIMLERDRGKMEREVKSFVKKLWKR